MACVWGRTPKAALALALWMATTAGCLPTTNIFDPSGPPDTLALTFVTGRVAFDDGAPVDGVVVDIYRESGGDGGGERVTATFAASDGRDAFSFEVAPDVTRVVIQPGRCGYSDVTIDIPDAYPEYAANLTPGSEFDINDGRPVVLRRDPPSRTVTGRVEALDETASASGIKVSLVEVGLGDVCRDTVAEATTAADGSFTLSPIADGRYVAVAFTEGTTVAISAVVDSCAFEPLADGTLPDVEVPLLSIRGGAGALALSPSATDDPGLPPGVIAEPRVNVVVGGFFEWADEMRLSEDPTFATGSTGWVPIESPRLYPSVGELVGNTNTTVFGQFRSACALSPLYSASVTYDGEPPDIFRVRVRDVEAEGSFGASTVVLESEETVSLAVDGFDETGVTVTVQVTPLQTGVEIPAPEEKGPTGAQGFTLREQVTVPPDEGRYTLTVDVIDVAGNRAGDAPYVFDLIRDTEPPTTPLPTVTELEISDAVAYLWLEERDCERALPDGTFERYVAFVCEENPRAYSFFEVRGGPELLDFTGFDQPPFAVPVFLGEETEIEIRAVDDAGNASESFGRVTVVHRDTRELIRLPIGMKLGPRRAPTLTSTSGTAFFGVTADTERLDSSGFDRLIAQPSWLPSVGLSPVTSPYPTQVRKLSVGNCNPFTSGLCVGEERSAAGLTAGGGRLLWLEGQWAIGPSVQPARLMFARPSGLGLLHIDDPAYSAGQVDDDDEGEAAPLYERCDDSGSVRCNYSLAWQGAFERRPGHGVLSEDQVLFPETGVVPVSLEDGLAEDPSEELTVVGPRFIGVHARMLTPAQRPLWGIEMTLDADAGTPLHFALLQYDNSNHLWEDFSAPGTLGLPSQTAAGGGRERLLTPSTTRLLSAADDEGVLFGVYVPVGVTITVPLYERLLSDGGPPLLEHDNEVFGLVNLPIDPAQTQISLTEADVLGLVNPTRIPRISMLDRDDDKVRDGQRAGITLATLSDGDLLPRVPTVDFVGEPPVDTLRDQPLTVGAPTRHVTEVTDGAMLAIPQTCSIVFEVEEPTAVEDMVVRGSGQLDDLKAHWFRSDDGTPFGRFQRHPVRGQISPSQFNTHVSGFVTQADPGVACELLPGPVVLNDTLTGSLPGVTADTGLYSGSYVAPAPIDSGVIGFSSTPVEVGVIPVSEGDTYFVAMRNPATGGDADLYLRYDATPTQAAYDCRPLIDGTEEDCYFTAPAGVSEVHIAVAGFLSNNPYEIKVIPATQVASLTLPADNIIYHELTLLTPGEFEVRLGYPSPVTWEYWLDYMDEANAYSYVGTDSDQTFEVIVGGPDDVDWSLYYEIYDDAPIELQTYPVTPGQVVSATIDGTGNGYLYLQFDAPPTENVNRCRVNMANSSPCGNSNGIVVPEGVSTLHVAVSKADDPSSYTINVEISEAGCRSVAGAPSYTATDASSKLPAGTYAVFLNNDGDNPHQYAVDPDPPPIEIGVLNPDDGEGPLRILGTALAPTVLGDDVVLGGLTSSAPACNLAFHTRTLPRVRDIAMTDGAALAAVDVPAWTSGGDRSEVRVAPLGGGFFDQSPIAASLPPGHRVMSLTGEGDDAWLVTTVSSGAEPTLWHLDVPRAATDADALTELVAIAEEGVPLQATDAVIHDGRAVIVGSTSTGPRLVEVALGEVDGAPTAALTQVVRLSFVPEQISLEGSDLFLWDPTQEGGRLVHRDLRAVNVLYPGGELEAAGFDILDEQVAIMLTDTSGQLTGRILLLDDANGLTVERQLPDTAAHTHMAFVHPEVIATLTMENDAFGLRLHDTGGTGSTVVTAMTAALSGLPTLDPYDPLPASAPRRLAARNGVVAVVGDDGSGPALSIVEVPAGASAMWGALTPALVGEALDSAPTGVATDGERVVVWFTDGTARAFVDDPVDGWREAPVVVPAGSRVVGFVDGRLVVLEAPPLSVGGRAPMNLVVSLIDIDQAGDAADAGTPDAGSVPRSATARLAAGAFTHVISTVFLEDGDLVLFDTSASPPALWRATLDGNTYRVSDGPHRPLVTGNEAIGTHAAPKAGPGGIYWIKRGQSGNALMRMRR